MKPDNEEEYQAPLWRRVQVETRFRWDLLPGTMPVREWLFSIVMRWDWGVHQRYAPPHSPRLWAVGLGVRILGIDVSIGAAYRERIQYQKAAR